MSGISEHDVQATEALLQQLAEASREHLSPIVGAAQLRGLRDEAIAAAVAQWCAFTLASTCCGLGHPRPPLLAAVQMQAMCQVLNGLDWAAYQAAVEAERVPAGRA